MGDLVLLKYIVACLFLILFCTHFEDSSRKDYVGRTSKESFFPILVDKKDHKG